MAEVYEEAIQKEKSGELTVAVARRASPENVELEARQSLSTPTTDNPGGNGFTGFDAVYANRCGYGRWRPDCLQALNRPGVLVAFLASYSFVLGFLVNGVHNVNISSIERRFSLSSTRMGLVSSFFDISGSTVALLIGYFGSGKRKPRLLAITTLISGIGSLIMASPHFLSDSYKLGEATDQMLCKAATPLRHLDSPAAARAISLALSSQPENSMPKSSGPAMEYALSAQSKTTLTSDVKEDPLYNSVSNSPACLQESSSVEESEENFSLLVFCILALSQLLHGVGGTALFTVGASLLDDSVDARRTPLFLGFIYGANIIGSGIGYFVGGQLLRIYVDVDIFGGGSGVPSGLNDQDTRWVGAWWIGPFLAGMLQLLLCLPLSLYGFELPQARKVRLHRVSQAHSTSNSADCPSIVQPSLSWASLKQWAKLSLQILKNPCFTFVTLGMTTEAMFVSGSAAFLPKIVENEFNVNASLAAIVSGGTVMPAAIFGLIFGGYLAKRFKFTIRDTLKFTITLCSVGALGCAVLWIRCDAPDIYGVHKAYQGHPSSSSPKPTTLLDSCNSRCHCETNFYEPVCSEEAGIFFSPCFAGCTAKDGNQYFDCSCVNVNPSQDNSTGSKGRQLSSGHCRQSCSLLWVFAVLLFLGMCASFMPIAPCDSVQLRCVPEEHKLYAQGIKTLVIRLLGSFMGPIVMGRLVDSSCWIWREKCDEQLSCWIYDRQNLVLAVFLFVSCLKISTVIFTSLALRFYRPPSTVQHEHKHKESGSRMNPAETADMEEMLESMVNSNANGANSRDGLVTQDNDICERF